jgi:hypothetical protein
MIRNYYEISRNNEKDLLFRFFFRNLHVRYNHVFENDAAHNDIHPILPVNTYRGGSSSGSNRSLKGRTHKTQIELFHDIATNPPGYNALLL